MIQVTMALLAALGLWPSGRAAGGVNVWTSHGPEGADVRVLAAAPGSPTSLLVGTMSGTAMGSGCLWASTDAAASWHQGAAGSDLGVVDAVAFDPSNPAVAYAGTGRTGLVKSQDGGRHWISISASPTVQAIAVAPSKPTTVYAASADRVIFRSDDGGVTWRSLSGGLPASTWVESVAVQADSELTVYAGTVGSGVFKSTDGGATWAAASAGLPNAGSARVSRLTFDFHRPANLLAVVWDSSNNQGGLYRSTDGGTSWVAIFPYSGFTALSALALGPRNPSLIYLAAGQTVFKSTDDGASWATLAVEAATDAGISALALDPNDAEVVYAGISGGAGVFKSADGGMTWTPSGRGLTDTSVGALALDPGPGNTLYALGNGIGLFISRDHGESWTSLRGLDVCAWPDAMVVDPSNPNTVYAGCGGNGAFKSSDGGHSWARINQGFSNVVMGVYALAIDPSNPLTLYAGSERFFDLGMFWGNLLYKTTNGGLAWEVTSSGLPTSSNTVNALAVDPRSPATVYAGGPGLWRSINGGRNWALLSSLAEFPSNAAIVVDPRDSDTVFCATGFVFVYKTADGGTTWTNSSPPGGAGKLILDPVRPSTLYVGGYGGISMSLDGGSTWALINGGLSNVHVTALVIDRTGTMLHAATDGGGVFDLEVSTATPEISLSPDALTMAAGTSTVLTATIDPPQLTDTQLVASSSDPAVASIPDVVTLPAGETSVSFTVTGVAGGGPAVITVRLPDSLGGASGTVMVTVTAGVVHVPRKHLKRSEP